MKKKISLFFTLSLIMSALLINLESCNKENINVSSDFTALQEKKGALTESNASVVKEPIQAAIAVEQSRDVLLLQKLMETYQSKPTISTVTAEKGGTINLEGREKTSLTIPKNAFTDSRGNVITGIVKVSIRLVQSPSDMVFSNKPTITASGQTLISFGEAKVDALQGTAAVKLKTGVNLQVNAPLPKQVRAQDGGIPMWKGDTTITTTTNGVNCNGVNTTYTRTVAGGIVWLPDTGTGAINFTTNQVSFPINTVGEWRNCDVLYSFPNKTTAVCYINGPAFNTQTGSVYSATQPTMLFFKPKGFNTVVKLYNVILNNLPTPGCSPGFHSYLNSFPYGIEGMFIAVSYNGGQLYAQKVTMNVPAPATGASYIGLNFTPTVVTEAQLATMIQSLDTY